MAVVAKSKERPQKILVAMYQLSEGKTTLLKYEDIVVRAFKLFPDEFALRGYPEYPDSSDIHKPLYGPLKRDGYIRSGAKKFGLTAKGVAAAEALVQAAGGRLEEERDARRLPRDVKTEIQRMMNSAAVELYAKGKIERALDTDFFQFVGATVRTHRIDFLGRVSTTDDAIKMAVDLNQPDPETVSTLSTIWAVLKSKYGNLIEMASAAGKRK